MTNLMALYAGLTAMVSKGRDTGVILMNLGKAFGTVHTASLSLNWRDLDLMGGAPGG